MIDTISQLAYLIAGALFIMALNWMNAPATARKGVYAGVAGTAIAVLVTWAEPSVIHHRWLVLATTAAFAVGIPLSRVPLTAVLGIRIGLGWAKSHSFFTGQTPVMKYNRRLMQAILHDKIQIAKAVNVTVISLEDAPAGYHDFDKGAARKFVIDPNGMIAA
jgi:NAD/NADP transhydrogenase beta subunit